MEVTAPGFLKPGVEIDMSDDITKLFISVSNTIQDAIRCIDSNQQGIALVVDENRHLLGTIVDGDIRRAILANLSPQTPVGQLLATKPEPYKKPITAPANLGQEALVGLMQERSVRHVPLVDDQGRVVGIFTVLDLIAAKSESHTLPLNAIVMAGGIGARLRPLTEHVPKPMLEVGGQPLLQWIVEGLRAADIRRLLVATHYKSEIITDYFGNGKNFGVEIGYIHEEKRTGTAGALLQVQDWSQPVLVINGDILTRADFRAMFTYHQEHKALMTVAVRDYEVNVPYGTVDLEGARIKGLTEKPSLHFFVNAGFYIIEAAVKNYLRQDDEFLDMTDLIERLLKDGQSVVGFPVTEYWLDIGQHAQYEQAQIDVQRNIFNGVVE